MMSVYALRIVSDGGKWLRNQSRSTVARRDDEVGWQAGRCASKQGKQEDGRGMGNVGRWRNEVVEVAQPGEIALRGINLLVALYSRRLYFRQ